MRVDAAVDCGNALCARAELAGASAGPGAAAAPVAAPGAAGAPANAAEVVALVQQAVAAYQHALRLEEDALVRLDRGRHWRAWVGGRRAAMHAWRGPPLPVNLPRLSHTQHIPPLLIVLTMPPPPSDLLQPGRRAGAARGGAAGSCRAAGGSRRHATAAAAAAA